MHFWLAPLARQKNKHRPEVNFGPGAVRPVKWSIRSFRTGIMAEYPVISTSQGTYG